MKKTIVILTHVGFDNTPYCSFVHSHAKAFVEQGYNVVVFAIIHWFPILSYFQKYKRDFIKKIECSKSFIEIDGVKVIYKKAITFSNFLYDSPINLNGISYYMSIKNIVNKIIKQENVVLIDAHTFKEEGYVAYKLKNKYPNITTTVTLHGTSFFRNIKTKNGIKLIKKIFNTVDYAVCVSNKIKNILLDIDVKNSMVIYNGINIFSQIDKFEKEKFSIISVGSLRKNKRFDVTIKSFSILIQKFDKLKLTIVGEGIEKENLKKMAKELKVEDKIEFVGRLNNFEAMNLMAKADIFLLPSVDEGFGIVYAEAMRLKCITIGTKNEGIDGFIKNNENGFLVESKEEEIANLIEKIYNNTFDLDSIIKKAQEDVRNLSWNKNVQQYINLVGEE